MIEARCTGKSRIDAIQEICNHYGFDEQAQIAVEECAELIKAICKRQRKFAGLKRAEYQDSPERVGHH